MDKRSSRDLLSDLPLSIIQSILTLVPIRDAIQTSILSRKWRYILATLPHLVFDDICASKKNSLNHFITQALFLHKGPIHKFQLSSFKSCCIDQWLIFLSRNDIRMLILNAKVSKNRFQIHSNIYSCENLIHLQLFICEIPPPPPTFNGFLCLRSLALENVEVPCKAIERIVANSPLLEEFTLNLNSGSLEFRIDPPNLKYFNVKGYYGEIFLSAPLLSKYSVVFYKRVCTPKCLQQKSSVCNYTNFLGGFTNLEELSGGGDFLKYLSFNVESCHRSLVFHNLRIIELSSVSYTDIKEIGVVVRLIMGAPNLHKLKISTCLEAQYASEVASVSLWESECAPKFTFERMKEIEMMDIGGGLLATKFVKFLLESSPVLETMIYKTNPYHKDRKLLILMAELLRYHRASANAEILFCKA